jgi:hypothetical protein
VTNFSTEKIKAMTTSMFKKPATISATAQSNGHQSARPAFLSFLKRPEERDKYSIASFPAGKEHIIRLMPVSADGAPQALEVTVLTVKHNGVEGKILAGEWFLRGVQPWLLKNFRDRLQKFVNGQPVGDVKLRTQKRIIFFGTRMTVETPEKPSVKELTLVNLAGTNYPGAKVGDGEDFLAGGAYHEDFDMVIGRKLKIVSSGAEARTRTLKITPERNATPLDDSDIAILPINDGLPHVPLLKDTLRESTREEIVQCLSETLPADVFEQMMREVQF